MQRTAGYTNHWTYYATAEQPEGGFSDAQWAVIVREAKAIIAAAAAEGIIVAGPSGTGHPVVKDDVILLNGVARNAHETFYLPKTPDEEDRRFHMQFLEAVGTDPKAKNAEVARGFCKTNGKPYDAVVASILAVANRVGKGSFKATTDAGAVKRVFASAADAPTKTAAHRLDGVRGHQLLPSTVARKLPAIYSQEDVADPIVQVKLFSPYTGAVWYLTEYDSSSRDAFGWADLGMGGGELGYISIPELEGLNRNGLPLVERDLYWTPVPLSRAKGGRMASAVKHPSVVREVEDDYRRQAITRGERDELLREIAGAESKQDAQRIVDQHRKGRTAASRVASRYIEDNRPGRY
ncbi:MAG: DUF2958 domain-containing protein [Actinobacteria bacterium]|nr:DUF2958 domain-containing protein [Actinomycetota bacterium]